MAARRMLVAGRYRLREPVGTGGMGRVWLARDEMLDRDVAVKEFVPPDWMTDEEKSRLKDRTLREARSAARLNHPHVVQIYDVVHADGLPWIVMEYVPSRSLHQVISQDGPLTPAATARIGLDVLDALTAAHRAGVLHRDIKPHNVLIGTDGRVVLTDFGLATFVDDGSVTGPGLVVGSPQYVSPERARDGASTVESDLWSLGATLYAAVEGRSPYARESAMATLMALATEPPDPPVQAGMLAPVLTGLLRHEPAVRLTATEVERRLRMIVAAGSGGTVTVPSPRRPSGNQGRAEVAVVSAMQADGGKTPPFTPALIRPLSAQRVAAGPIAPPPPLRIAPAPPRAEHPVKEASPTRQFSRSTAAAAGLTLVAVLGVGGILAGYLIQRGNDRSAAVMPPTGVSSAGSSAPSRGASASSAAVSGRVVGGFSPVVCSGPAPRSAPTAPQKNAARGVGGFALIGGWSYFTDGTGFHMPVPDGWSYQKIGTTYCFRDPAGDRALSLDVGRNPAGNPVKACRTEAKRLVDAGLLPRYQQITIEARPLLNKAALWEYLYNDAEGVRLHAQTQWFATAGKAYAISWVTRDLDWPSDLAKVSMVLSTFYADQVR